MKYAIIFNQTLPGRVTEDMPSRLQVLKGQFEELPFVRLNYKQQRGHVIYGENLVNFHSLEPPIQVCKLLHFIIETFDRKTQVS
jgi:hypothetical protein